VEKIKGPKRKKTLPVVLDLSEVKALLSVVENLKHRAILTITYSAGLRIAETARLKVTDIDSKRMMVWVQQGKGGKDRLHSNTAHLGAEPHGSSPYSLCRYRRRIVS